MNFSYLCIGNIFKQSYIIPSTEGLYSKAKNLVILGWTIVLRFLESFLQFLLGFSEDHRYMAAVLDEEKIRMKHKMRVRNHVKCPEYCFFAKISISFPYTVDFRMEFSELS